MLLLVMGCTDNSDAPLQHERPLYSILSSEHTGIDFRNDLKETLYMNGLFYEYYYNGSGVAVGDFNKDDLPDVYLVSSLGKNKLYINKGELQFEDVTARSGVQGEAVFATGVTTVDINADGLLDIYVCASGRIRDPEKRRNELFINLGVDDQGVPRFEERAQDYGLDLEEFSTQAAFFDYDRDGDMDMFLINHDVEIYGDHQLEEFLHTKGKLSGERLYKNDSGIFRDVTDRSGVINNRLGFGLGVAIGDVNNDGWPDVYTSHDFSGKDYLYLNNQDGTFEEVSTKAMRHISNFAMGNDIADYNNDGWPDIVSVDMVSEDNYGIKTSMSGMNPAKFHEHVALGLHHQYMFNTLQLNNGTKPSTNIPAFSEVAHLAGISNTDWSWAPLFVDMNNDGYQDLFVANGIKRDFRNNDFVNYHKKVREGLLKQQSVNKEAYINHMMDRMPTRFKTNYFYLNNRSMGFEKMNQAWQLDSIPTCSNGAAYADFDNDGDMDLIVNNMDDRAYVYQNHTDTRSNNYLKVKLSGSKNNPYAVGTRVTIHYSGMQQMREQYFTRGFQSAMGEFIHFGLGQTHKIDSLEVRWPDGTRQSIKNVQAGQVLKVNYRPSPLPQKRSRPVHLFSTTTDAIPHKHIENDFDDFERESLLPHKMSQHGPALATADINQDGLEDVFVGGAMGHAASVYVQTEGGSMIKSPQQVFEQHKAYEDVHASFFDVDNDGDQDLYVVSGGNERVAEAKEYEDRLYLNESGKLVYLPDALPKHFVSGACVKPFDFDKDGDIDLFVGGRQVPGKYPFAPDSYLLENQTKGGRIIFKNVTAGLAPMLSRLGMVTDAEWVDIDGDSNIDLLIVGEWMPATLLRFDGQTFTDVSQSYGLADQKGWWSTVTVADMDNDGDVDIIAGNLGLNYKYKASAAEPFEVYAKDFDNNQQLDIVLGYYNEGKLFPLRGRECTSNQMPFVKKKFASYDAFGKATLREVYGEENMGNALHYTANTFASTYFENEGGKLTPHLLPEMAQLSSVNTIAVLDANGDGAKDLLLAGNMYGSEVETPRNDASYGVLLQGDGKGSFFALPAYKSGLYIEGEIRQMDQLVLNGISTFVLATNNDSLQVLTLNSTNQVTRK